MEPTMEDAVPELHKEKEANGKSEGEALIGEKPTEEEKPTTDDKPTEDKPTEDKTTEEKTTEEKTDAPITEDQPTEEKATEEKATEEKATEEKATEEKATEEKATEEKPKEEEKPVEIEVTPAAEEKKEERKEEEEKSVEIEVTPAAEEKKENRKSGVKKEKREEKEELKEEKDVLLSPNAFALKKVDSKIIKLSEQWQSTQTRTFTAWINFQLRGTEYKLEDISVDLGNGVALAALIEVLAEETVKVNRNPKMRIHSMENVNICLRFVTEKGVKLVNISAEDIVEKNLKIILGLIWTLIRKFKIEGLQVDDAAGNDALLLWVQRKVKDYGIRVHNFHTSWQSGLALAAIIHSTYPDALNYHKLPNKKNAAEVLEACFVASEKCLDIPRMLDVSDLVDIEKPDEHSVLAYISAHYHVQQQTKDWLTQYSESVPKIKENALNAIKKLSEPIKVETREELQKLINEFNEDTECVIISSQFYQIEKIANSLNKMGLSGTEFDYTPFEELKRIHDNMLKAIQKRKADLDYADSFLKDIEAFQAAYLARVKEVESYLNTVTSSMDNLPTNLPERLNVVRGHSDGLAALESTFEELAHTGKRLEGRKFEGSDLLDKLRSKWENLSKNVEELLKQIQELEEKLRQYAKDAPILENWMDKVVLQFENLNAVIDSILDPEATPSQEELKSVVDQFGIINVVYNNKKKDYERIEGLVKALRAAGLQETCYTPITFEELSEKWKNLKLNSYDTIAQRVSKVQGKINISERYSKLLEELEEFLASEEKLRQERSERKIEGNDGFQELIKLVSERVAAIEEKQTVLSDQEFKEQVPEATVSDLSMKFYDLLARVKQDGEDLRSRHGDAEKYAARSRELNTWITAATTQITPPDKPPVLDAEVVEKELTMLTTDFIGQSNEYTGLGELTKKLNSRLIPETIFGGVPYAELSANWETLKALVETRKTFLAGLNDILQLAKELDNILAKEREFLEQSRQKKFTSEAEVKEHDQLLGQHRQKVENCRTKLDNAYSASADTLEPMKQKIDKLLEEFDEEIQKKAKLRELLEEYAKKANEWDSFLTTSANQLNSEAIQKYASEDDGVTQLENALKELEEKIPEKDKDLEELEKSVAELQSQGSQENVFTSHSYYSLTQRWKELKDTRASIQEHMPEFIPLAKEVQKASQRLKNIGTEEGDDHKSARLEKYLAELREHEQAIKVFSSNELLGAPLNLRFNELLEQYDAAIKNWKDIEALYDVFVARAAKFEKVTVEHTAKLQEALNESGRNLVAEYADFSDEYKNLSVEFEAIGELAEKTKPIGGEEGAKVEALYNQVCDKWVDLKATMDRMRKRIQGNYTPDEEVQRAIEYIASLRGPKFVSPHQDTSLIDPAMDQEVTRICVMGDTSGKTSLIAKFISDKFPEAHSPTQGEAHSEFVVQIDDHKYQIDILDTNNKVEYSTLRNTWCTWPDGFMFVYSINDLKSFETIYSLHSEVMQKRAGAPFGHVVVSVGADEKENREVPTLHGQSAAVSIHCKYFETSAKTGENVALAFRELLKAVGAKKAVSARLEREKEASHQLVKSRSKKSKTDLMALAPSLLDKPLTADAIIDWRLIRLNQLLVLYELQKDLSNRKCADCNRENPDWVARGFMVRLCVQCAHIHKMTILNPRIPKPKNLLIEFFPDREIREVTALCNGRANMVLERVIPADKKKPEPTDSREVKAAWIKSKYVAHEFYLSMNNEINNKQFQYHNKLAGKYTGRKLLPQRTEPAAEATHVRLDGPKSNFNNQVVKGDFFAAESVSTFPKGEAEDTALDGGDIVDTWGVDIGAHHMFVCIADGCGWGSSPGSAAKNVVNSFLSFVDANYHKLAYVDDASALLLKSVLVAHDSTTKNLDAKSVINYWEVGTSALLGGVLVTHDSKGNQGFLCVSVGNCKAYLVHFGKSVRVTDITENSRDPSLDEDDPGGCIGPHQEAGAPDLRNLQIFYHSVEAGDVVVLMTDGVYENFDPEYLGLAPRDVGSEKYKWDTVRTTKKPKLKGAYAERIMERLLEKARSPVEIEQALLDHARTVTIPRKAFMEREGKTPAKNYVAHPGRLDHATVCCFTVQKEYPNYNQ